MNNTVYDIDFTRALPDPLKDDENILALGRAIAGELQENIRLSRLAIIYARIDELDEGLLDILARDLHVDWYEDTYPVEVKRQVIKDSVKVHKRLGTKYAIVTALGNIFPNSEVQEWYEYGGTHHRFRIILNTTDAKIPVDLVKIVKSVNLYKRLTAHLDEIIQRTLLKTEFYVDGNVYERQKAQITAVLPDPSLKSKAHVGGAIETVQRERFYIEFSVPHPTSSIFTAITAQVKEKVSIMIAAKAQNAKSDALIGAGIETTQRERFCVELIAPHPTSGIYATTTAQTKERVNIIVTTKALNITSDLRYGNAVMTTERTVM